MIPILNHQTLKQPTMNFNNSTYSIKVIGIVTMLVILAAASFTAEAQRFSRYGSRMRRGPKTNIGIEASMGTRSFRLKSDISVINKMAVPMEGASFGAIIGNKFYRVKLKQGFFNSADAVAQKFQLSETKGILNLYLLQSLLSNKPKYFEAYFITSVDRSLVKFYGSYVEKKNNSSTSGAGSQSGSGGAGSAQGTGTGSSGSGMPQCDGPMGDPDGNSNSGTGSNTNTNQDQSGTPTDPDPSAMSAKRFLGKSNIMHANIGMGLECHIPGRKHFVNLFAETQYGIPFSATTSNAAFNNTKASAIFTVNFGLSFGISR
jgi:uncharacterized membrane protein YgcG